jgi:hypothetical protein
VLSAFGLPPNIMVQGVDRPIGSMGDSPVTAKLPNTVVVLTREIIENRMQGAKLAMMIVDFKDTANFLQLGGDAPAEYQMFLQVEKVN